MMEEHKLSFEELHISLSEIYEAMGYGSAEPDELLSDSYAVLRHMPFLWRPPDKSLNNFSIF